MKKNYLSSLVAIVIISTASLAFGTTSTYTSVIEGDSPVSFWPLNETSGTLIHDIVGTNNAFATNASNLTLGAPGILFSNGFPSDTAIAFNPTSSGNGFILTPPSGENFATNITDPLTFSVEGWFDVPATFAGSSLERCMISCDTSCPQGWQMVIENANTSPVPQGWIAESEGWDTPTQSFGTGTYPNKWTYYIMTYDATTLKLYTNGVLATSLACAYNPETSFDRGPLFMGAYDDTCPSTNISPANYYQGSMENVAYYNHALTATQIANHYKAGTNGSSGPTAPSITTQPSSTTNYTTQTATFTVSASGTAPLSYQWKVESSGSYVNLSNGGQFSGATTATLSISSLVATNATNYEVVVTNSAGSATSDAAKLTVLNATPSITTQPANKTNNVGQTATFSVVAAGLPPLSYQWKVESSGSYVNLSNGGQFSGVTNTTLSISSLALTNATNYEVVVTNSAGSVTSSAASLTVNATSNTYQSIVLGDGPVAYWPMQETNGPTIHDIVSTNNGSLVTSTDGRTIGLGQHTNFVTAGSGSTDGATYLIGGPGGLPGVSGDTAIYFTNLNTSTNNSQIVVPYNEAFDSSNALTAEAWIKVPSYPIGYTNTAYQTPLGLEANGGAQNGWWMAVETDGSGVQGEIFFNLAKAPGSGWTAPTSTTSVGGQWVYAVEVFTGSNTNLVCYTNSVVMANVTATNYESESLYGTHKLPFIIGSYCASYNGGGVIANGFERGDFWHGAVSHVAIYTNALTANQISNHYFYATNTSAGTVPSITSQPASTTNNVGQTATFSVTASGTGPLSYQWKVQSSGSYVNLSAGGQYSGVTSSTLSISSLALTNATNYEVVVTNAFGSVTSAAATLTVLVPPSITVQPASTTNYTTQTATFSVTATGSAPLSYQWKVDVNGSYVNLSNAGQFSGVTSTTLTISNLVATNATNYEVVVTNSAGSVTSAAATLSVLNAIPSITTQPASTTNTVGQTATFTVAATGLAPLSYQWKVQSSGSYVNLSNGGQFSGVTNTTLSISSLALTNATNYEVVVTNSAGSVTSAAATLTVNSSANYQSIILGDAPVSYWPMQETTGPTINDIVTTNAGPFNGTLQISTDGFTNGGTDGEGKVWGIIHETFTNSTSAVATDGSTYHFGGPGGLAGVSGDTAIYFTNLNGQLNNAQIAMGTGGTGAYESQLDSSTFTIEAWIKVPTYTIGWTSNSYQIPLSLNAEGNSGNTDNGWFIGVKTDSSGSTAYGEMFFEAGTGTTYTSNGPSAQVFSGKWVYAVQEYNGTATVIYTNGTLMVSNAQTYKPLSNTATHELPLIVGSQTAYYFGGAASSGNTRADFWDGGISHVAYYNYALAASHITNHYYYGTNASFGGAFSSPVEPAFKPTIGATLTPALLSGSSEKQFQMQVSAVANQNYTLQMSTDLSSGNWVSLYTTNSTTNTTFVLTDPAAATNKQRFYRVLVGQ